MELVDEQDDAPLGPPHLSQHGLQALLELTAVFRARHQRPHIQGEDRTILQSLGYVAAQDALREALDDRGLADARLADEHRVVLRLARKDADRAPDLVVAPDDGVEFSLPRLRHEVDPVLLERLVCRLRIVGRDALRAAHLLERAEHLRAVEVEAAQEPLEGVGLGHVDQAEQQVLDRDELVLELGGLRLGASERLVDGLRDVNLGSVDGPADLRQAVELPLHRELRGSRGKAQLFQQAGHDAALLRQQGGKQVPGVDLRVRFAAGDGLRLGDGRARHLGEFG